MPVEVSSDSGQPAGAGATGACGPQRRLPAWLRSTAPGHPAYFRVRRLVRALRLHTVCESARCPNIGECWGRGTATFMILGAVCTRDCRFCAVPGGLPAAVDADEPERVARAVARLGLRHAVITSVTRDDLPDGGAAHFAATLAALHRRCPETTVEVLVPDFGGDERALATVLAAAPDVLAHNVETVPRLYPAVRPQARYERSLALLARAHRIGPAATKSGLMLGLGETAAEIGRVLDDLRAVGCRSVTLGQYLSPARAGRLPVARFVPPEEFAAWRQQALARGFAAVESGPLVRSSYRAERHAPPRAGRPGRPAAGGTGAWPIVASATGSPEGAS